MNYTILFENHKESCLFGRYITLNGIIPLIQKYNFSCSGNSVLGKPIYKIIAGKGKTKILMWSQMHGNEGTTTEAVFDFLHFLHNNNEIGVSLLQDFTFCILPMVNPDGAELYTRANANNIDLNRDSVNLSQPESKILRTIFDEFKPDFCFNLHDQRTIFGAGNSGKPATVSFLAPAFNEDRDYNTTRIKAVQWIQNMNQTLQEFIPNQIGRFDDGFNLNCIGDKFQSLNVPTILFEAGHFQDDYQREITRKMIFIALISGLVKFNENVIVANDLNVYLKIPQNNIVFYDIMIKNIQLNYDGIEKITNIAVQFKEELKNGEIHFVAYISNIGDLVDYFFHKVYDANGGIYFDQSVNFPKIDEVANFLINSNWYFKEGIQQVFEA